MTTVRYNKETKEWDRVDPDATNPDNIKLPNFLLIKLDKVKADLRDDADVTAICVGEVGSGKSTLLRLCCRYVSNENFHPRDHVVRDVHDIKRVMKAANKFDAILIDEGSGIFASGDTTTKKTKWANLVLDVCRQKNLFIGIAAPNFDRLGRPVAVDRSKFLLRTYRDKSSNKRGKVCYYTEKEKNKLWRLMKKGEALSIVKPKSKHRGEFGEDKTHEELYKQVKDETLNKVLDLLDGPDKEEHKPLTREEIEKNYKENIIKANWNEKSEVLGKLLGVSDRTIRDWKKKMSDRVLEEQNREKILANPVF